MTSVSRIVMPQPAAPLRRVANPAAIFTSAPQESVPSTADQSILSTATSSTSIKSGDIALGPYPKAKWTVLNYCAADNNLYPYIYNDVASMEKFGSTGSVQMVTQLDHQGGGAYRFRIEKDPQSNPESDRRIDSPVLQSLGPVNMSDPKTLADFISWGIKNFPAEHYMLVIADHGKGWEGLVQDDSHKGWMSVPQLREALDTAQKTTGQKLDVLGFDACQMASVEVASEIKDYARFMIASQALEGREGWPYSHILGQSQLAEIDRAHLFKSDVEARQVLNLVVQSAAENQEVLPTMAGLDLSKMAGLEKSLKDFSSELAASGADASGLRQLRANTQSFGFVYDLGDFLKQISQSAAQQNQTKLKAAADQCLQQLQQVIVVEHHSPQNPGATGLSVELKQARTAYEQLAFNKATDWKQAVDQFAKA